MLTRSCAQKAPKLLVVIKEQLVHHQQMQSTLTFKRTYTQRSPYSDLIQWMTEVVCWYFGTCVFSLHYTNLDLIIFLLKSNTIWRWNNFWHTCTVCQAMGGFYFQCPSHIKACSSRLLIASQSSAECTIACIVTVTRSSVESGKNEMVSISNLHREIWMDFELASTCLKFIIKA